MLTWSDLKNKAVRISRDTTPGTLTQLEQDMNTAYHMFNAKFGRYYSRKQQFTDITANQSIYQTPIDSIRILGMTVRTADGSNAYSPPIKEIRSEYEWRLIKTNPTYSSSWIAYYYVLGNDEIEVWPVPSDTIANGIRFYYQPQDYDLSIDDITSNTLTPAETVSITNGNTLVTSTGSSFTNQQISLQFQPTGITDTSFYEIVEVPTSSTLLLKSAFVPVSMSGLNYRIGQVSILPQEYQDVPVHYALNLFFSSKGNEQRATLHKGMFDASILDAIESYASSTEGNVISENDNVISPWVLTPLPGLTP